MMSKFVLAALAVLSLAFPAAALAADTPSYAKPPAPPEENIHGRVTSFNDRFSLNVRDDRGYVDSVQLHPGTIINPTGLRIRPGMVVSVLGHNAGTFFAANEIDTPYRFEGAVPYYAGRRWDGDSGWWRDGYGYRNYGYRGYGYRRYRGYR